MHLLSTLLHSLPLSLFLIVGPSPELSRKATEETTPSKRKISKSAAAESIVAKKALDGRKGGQKRALGRSSTSATHGDRTNADLAKELLSVHSFISTLSLHLFPRTSAPFLYLFLVSSSKAKLSKKADEEKAGSSSVTKRRKLSRGSTVSSATGGAADEVRTRKTSTGHRRSGSGDEGASNSRGGLFSDYGNRRQSMFVGTGSSAYVSHSPLSTPRPLPLLVNPSYSLIEASSTRFSELWGKRLRLRKKRK